MVLVQSIDREIPCANLQTKSQVEGDPALEARISQTCGYSTPDESCTLQTIRHRQNKVASR